MAIVKKEHGGNEIEQAAALCHDTVEDQGGQPVLAKRPSETPRTGCSTGYKCVHDGPAAAETAATLPSDG